MSPRWFVLMILALGMTASAAGEGLRLRYAFTEGDRFHVTLRLTGEEVTDTETQKRVETALTQSSVWEVRRVRADGSAEIEVTLGDAARDSKVNGEVVWSVDTKEGQPLTPYVQAERALKGKSFHFTVTSRGGLWEISGLDRLVEAMDAERAKIGSESIRHLAATDPEESERRHMERAKLDYFMEMLSKESLIRHGLESVFVLFPEEIPSRRSWTDVGVVNLPSGGTKRMEIRFICAGDPPHEYTVQATQRTSMHSEDFEYEFPRNRNETTYTFTQATSPLPQVAYTEDVEVKCYVVSAGQRTLVSRRTDKNNTVVTVKKIGAGAFEGVSPGVSGGQYAPWIVGAVLGVGTAATLWVSRGRIARGGAAVARWWAAHGVGTRQRVPSPAAPRDLPLEALPRVGEAATAVAGSAPGAATPEVHEEYRKCRTALWTTLLAPLLTGLPVVGLAAPILEFHAVWVAEKADRNLRKLGVPASAAGRAARILGILFGILTSLYLLIQIATLLEQLSS